MNTFLQFMYGGAENLAAYLAAHVLLCLLPAVTDMKAIMAYDLMATPGLVAGDKLVSSGCIPTQAEIRQWLAA